MKALIIAALLWSPRAAGAAPAESVRFKTADGWTIGARYQAPQKGRPVAIMVHGVAASKEEWSPLQAELTRRGIGSLALDLRGHGESVSGPSGHTDFRSFDAAGEWPKAQKDVEAAAAFLVSRGISARRIGYIGASIGANLVAWARPAPRWLALLSPGIDYRGVRLPQPPKDIPLLVAASPGDAYAYQTADAYSAARPGIVFLRARAGHGAQMFSDPEFLKSLLDWIAARGR
jgi:alpha-beta hydrolase superfamily lysophospholipase